LRPLVDLDTKKKEEPTYLLLRRKGFAPGRKQKKDRKVSMAALGSWPFKYGREKEGVLPEIARRIGDRKGKEHLAVNKFKTCPGSRRGEEGSFCPECPGEGKRAHPPYPRSPVAFLQKKKRVGRHRHLASLLKHIGYEDPFTITAGGGKEEKEGPSPSS